MYKLGPVIREDVSNVIIIPIIKCDVLFLLFVLLFPSDLS